MYEFATMALLGLAVAKLGHLAGYYGLASRAARATFGVVLGVCLTWALDYSAFAGWGIQFREGWMGPVATGLTIAGIAALWHEVLSFIGSYSRRATDQATEIETHISRVA
jgi:hypothetical protein